MASEASAVLAPINKTKSLQSHTTFLNLPAELRLQIYSFALAPTGTICLFSSKSKRYATDPTVSPALLRTCHRVYSEAHKVLYAENTVTLVLDAHDVVWPTISPLRLSRQVLPRLQHVCAVLDCTNEFAYTYEDVDFGAFARMTGLCSLRIAVVRCRDGGGRGASLSMPLLAGNGVISLRALLLQVLERVPAQTEVTYGTVPGTSADDFLKNVVESRRAFLETEGSNQVRFLAGRGVVAKDAEALPDNVLVQVEEGIHSAQRGRLCGVGFSDEIEAQHQGT